MTGGTFASILASVLMLVLVVGSYAARGVPIGQTIKMALAWVGIFAVGLLLYGLVNGGIADVGNTRPPEPPARTTTGDFT